MDYLTLLGIMIGSLLVGIYIYNTNRNRTSTNLARAAILFLSGTLLIGGVKVIIFAFNPELLVLVKKEGIESAHIFLGGLAICWVSIISASEILKDTC